jgi:hypothetical protein
VTATIAHRGPVDPGRGKRVMATGSSVRKATLADAPRLAQALASAFQDDPVMPGSSLTSSAAAAVFCRPSWSSACAGWPFPTTRSG